MGQGCSSAVSYYGDPFSESDRKIFAEKPDPVMREIMKASLAATEGLRHKALRERFGGCCSLVGTAGGGSHCSGALQESAPLAETNYQTHYHKHKDHHQQRCSGGNGNDAKKKPSMADRPHGQDHLLFQNFQLSAETPNLDVAKKALPRLGGRGHRKIAESFGTEATDRPSSPQQPKHQHQQHQQPSQQPHPNNTGANTTHTIAVEIDSALLEEFEISLSKRMVSECPTRLYLRRRPKSRGIRRFRSQPHKKSKPLHEELAQLGEGSPYRPGTDYFGGTAQSGGNNNNNNHPKTNNSSYGEALVPDAKHSTHIYAIRYGSGPSAFFGENNSPRPAPVPATTKTTATASATTPDTPPPPPPNSPAAPAPPTNTAAIATATFDKKKGPTTSSSDTNKNPVDEASIALMTSKMFGPKQMGLAPKRDVLGWTTVSEEHAIYVVDVGLTPEGCDALVTTTEQACKGRYAAYTYAKQTLGCREYPLLAMEALGPVHSMVGAIYDKFENGSPGTSREEIARCLQLDAREPHIVKYDVTKKERQKLDMHTDKSEWTFLIALSNGCGIDYEGGGTYFECLDATVHVQKGHALVFPGKLRHRGQAIHHGLRFLLVGFLIDKTEDMKKLLKATTASSNHSNSSTTSSGTNNTGTSAAAAATKDTTQSSDTAAGDEPGAAASAPTTMAIDRQCQDDAIGVSPALTHGSCLVDRWVGM